MSSDTLTRSSRREPRAAPGKSSPPVRDSVNRCGAGASTSLPAGPGAEFRALSAPPRCGDTRARCACGKCGRRPPRSAKFPARPLITLTATGRRIPIGGPGRVTRLASRSPAAQRSAGPGAGNYKFLPRARGSGAGAARLRTSCCPTPPPPPPHSSRRSFPPVQADAPRSQPMTTPRRRPLGT
ncbi:translation initiation factor IF-2-like [Schistocerca americana]|uniref:translation initiation factor IF-2-like n=1 Tax=Schistocerca americana TaxID=7009 RepID=UPI001F5039F0|nr:translation initiation factor IF-2-like [Schistocerca americana]